MLNSLKLPMRCRIHSRATKIGQRTWKRKLLCSNGVPCRSRIRKRTSPSSDSSIASLRRAKLTRAALTTERSSAIASSSRTNPWSRTSIVSGAMPSAVAVTAPTVAGAQVGTSGFSYPSWRPGFYPSDARPEDFLRLYAERLPSVELNVTGYRLPSEEQFERWAGTVPDGFTFAVKMSRAAVRRIDVFQERVRRLGDRLGVVRLVVDEPRDEGL